MSVLEISRVDLIDETYNLTPLFPTLNLTGATVAVALLAKGGKPTGTTVWSSATLAGGSVTVRLAGPDANSTGALAVPGTCELWAKVTTTNGQVDAAKVARINVSGAGAVLPLPALYVSSVNGMTGAVTIAAGGGSVTDNGDGTATTTSSSVVDNGNGTATAA